MRAAGKSIWLLASAAALSLAMGTAAQAAAPTASVHSPTVTAITTFEQDPASYGGFAESMTDDGHGNLLVTVTTWNTNTEGVGTANIGQVWRVRPNGAKTMFGPAIDLTKWGMLTGITRDSAGNVYVGYASFDTTELPGVMRLTPSGRMSRWMTLTADAWPNGLLVVGHRLYVTDSSLGSVWRGTTRHPTVPGAAWFTSDLLAATNDTEYPISANGIAWRDGALYLTNWNVGRVIRVPLLRHGRAGTPTTVAEGTRLAEADGIVFDRAGRLWISVNANGGSVAVLDRHGRLTVTPLDDPRYDYPTAPVLAQGRVYLSAMLVGGMTPAVLSVTGLGR